MRRLLSLIIILLLALIAWEAAGKYLPALTSKLTAPRNTVSTPTTTFKATSEEELTINLVKQVRPSVVAIGAQTPAGQSPLGGSPNNDNNLGPFSFFFGNPDQNLPNSPQSPNNSSQDQQFIGSGFIIQKDGLIVTNKHVVSDNTLKYIVVDDQGNKYNVDKIYRDPLNDIALIKVSNPPVTGFPEIQMGDSSNLQVGQYVLAFGTPLGEFKNSVTHGIISGLGRGITAGSPFEGYVEQLDNVIQTDAAISPGNSGGPLINSNGQVIGINTAIAQQGQNIGFAIPINVIKDSINNFNNTGQFNRPYLGIAYVIIGKQSALVNGVPQGALVQDVIQGSAADKAGIQKDDIITKIDDQTITDDTGNNSISSIIGNKKIGDSLSLTVYRDGKTMTVTATLQAAPNQ